MPRCGDFNRFVSVDQADPELDITLDHDKRMISGIVRLATCCGDCSQDIMEAYQDFQRELDFEHSEVACNGGLELLDEEAEAEYRMEGTGRQVRHFYGVNITATVVCRDCDASLEVEEHCEVQASHMQPLMCTAQAFAG